MMSVYGEGLIKAFFFASVKINKRIYFSHWLRNGLFYLDLDSQKIEFVCGFREEMKTGNLHNYAFVYRREIWFIPSTNGEKIAVYSLETGQMKYISLPTRDHKNSTNKFSSVLKKNEQVWLIPDGYDALLNIDCSSGIMKLYDKWPTYLKWESDISRGFKGAAMIGNKIYMWPFEGKWLCIYDIGGNDVTSMAVPREIPESSRMVCYEDELVFWEPTDISKIWFYFTNNRMFVKSNIICSNNLESNVYYVGNILDGKLWLLPFWGRSGVCIDIEKQEIDMFTLDDDLINGSKDLRYQSTARYEDGVVFTSDFEKDGNVMPIVYISNDGDICFFNSSEMDIVRQLRYLFDDDDNAIVFENTSKNGYRIFEYIMNRLR